MGSETITPENLTNTTPTQGPATKVALVSDGRLAKAVGLYRRLKEKGATEDKLATIMEMDALQFGVDLEAYKGVVAAKMSEKTDKVGKLEVRKEKTKAVQAKHLIVTGFINEIITTGTTDVPKFQEALKELAAEADGWVLMTAVGKDSTSQALLFTVNDSGWADGKRKNQYSDRPQMTKANGTRVQFPYTIRQP